MKQKFIAELKKNKLISCGDKVIAALSGGADSMTLLHLLYCVKDEIGFSLCAAHVNHCLRGEESERDERFVRSVCEKMNIELHVLRADIGKISTEKNLGLEECGRLVRYEFFESIDKTAKTATAHTLSDNLETVLLNLTRGSALNGLCGIPEIRGKIIRPLLRFTRAEIESYCAENSIEYVTDSSNFSDEYNRNKIRNSVIPLLKSINPSVEAGLGRCIDSINEDESFLRTAAEQLAAEAALDRGADIEAYEAAKLLHAHPSIRKRTLRLIVTGKTNGKPQNCHIALLNNLLESGEAVRLSGEFYARLRKGALEVVKSSAGEQSADCLDFDKTAVIPYDKSEGDIQIDFCSALIRTQIVNKTDFDCQQKIHKTSLESYLDYDKICDNACFRTRRDGDKIRQCSGNCTKTLKKLFNEKGIPPEKRDEIVILADENGIAWLEGYGCDAHCAIDDKTERMLRIYVQRQL